MTASVGDRLQATLGRPELAWLVERARRRLARGQALSGRVVLQGASHAQQGAAAALFGRSPGRSLTVSVDLDELDRLVRRAELAASLADAVQRLVGPVTDATAAAARQQATWAAILQEARQRAGDRPVLCAWLDEVGLLLRRLAGGDPAAGRRLLDGALHVADRLPCEPPASLAVLAADVLGDSHALDAGAPVGTLAVRAAAKLAGLDAPDGSAARRRVWAKVGVVCDELSAPVLVLNLPADAGTLAGRVLDGHAEAGEPARLSSRQLLRDPPAFNPGRCGRGVFVCENAAVVAAAADRLGPDGAPLVCVEGQRRTAAGVLLSLLADAGFALAYHGDFDWGGLRIGNVLIGGHGASPWRYRTDDYLASPPGRPLRGAPSVACWDPELAPALRARGVAVHEEQVLDTLLADLASHAS